MIFNRVSRVAPALEEKLATAGLPGLGSVPPDDNVSAADLEGKSLLELPLDSPAVTALGGILAGSGIIAA